MEYVFWGIYFFLGFCLVLSVVCVVVLVVKMFDRWDVCGKISCEYFFIYYIVGVNFLVGEVFFSIDIVRYCDGVKKDFVIFLVVKLLVEVLFMIVGKINDF